MLGNVKPECFLVATDAQPDCLADNEEGQRDSDSRPCRDREDTGCLQTEKLKASAVEESAQLCAGRVSYRIAGCGGRCEQTYRKCTPYTVHAVDCDCTYRVVYMELVVKQPNAEYNEQTSDSADDGGAECVYNIAARSYGYKTCKRCIKTHGDIGLTVLYPCKDHLLFEKWYGIMYLFDNIVEYCRSITKN